jgi:hypothetical protein
MSDWDWNVQATENELGDVDLVLVLLGPECVEEKVLDCQQEHKHECSNLCLESNRNADNAHYD